MKEKIYELDLFDQVSCTYPEFNFIRVPGGWVYESANGCCFIPMHKEIIRTKNANINIKKEAKKVIDFLNQKAKRNFDYSESSMRFVTARLKDLMDERKMELEQAGTFMRKVVSLKAMDPFFVERNLLRPQTLYNKTKFNIYLEEVITHEKSSK